MRTDVLPAHAVIDGIIERLALLALLTTTEATQIAKSTLSATADERRDNWDELPDAAQSRTLVLILLAISFERGAGIRIGLVETFALEHALFGGT